jgi:hypothetical protein
MVAGGYCKNRPRDIRERVTIRVEIEMLQLVDFEDRPRRRLGLFAPLSTPEYFDAFRDPGVLMFIFLRRCSGFVRVRMVQGKGKERIRRDLELITKPKLTSLHFTSLHQLQKQTSSQWYRHSKSLSGFALGSPVR